MGLNRKAMANGVLRRTVILIQKRGRSIGEVIDFEVPTTIEFYCASAVVMLRWHTPYLLL